MDKKSINIFIVHHSMDVEHVLKLKEQLQLQNYDVRDSSIIETEPSKANNLDYIKTLIGPIIDWAEIVLVLVGTKTYELDWVNWGIEYAIKHHKRVVGIFIPGATDADIPERLNDLGDACVTWRSEKLVTAIEGENIWHDSTGHDRPIDQTGRTTC